MHRILVEATPNVHPARARRIAVNIANAAGAFAKALTRHRGREYLGRRLVLLVGDRVANPAAPVAPDTENGRHLYVGRSNELRGRYRNHCGATEKGPPFAILLAREATGRTRASYHT